MKRAAALDTRVNSAVSRLGASRQALADHVQPPQERAWRAVRAQGSMSRRWAAAWRLWRNRLQDAPAALLALHAVESWWQRNPWRLAGEAVADEWRASISPWVRRHPWGTAMVSSALVAGLLAWRPWRHDVVQQQLQQTPRRVRRWLWQQVSGLPMQTVISAVLLATASARENPGVDVDRRTP